MAAAWSMPVEFSPPRIAIVVDKHTYTHELILASGRLAINLPGRALADLTFTVGSVSGRPERGGPPDKFTRYGIEAVSGPVLGLPLVAGCIAWMECRLIPEPHTQQAYDTMFVEVVSAQADERVFARGRWSFRDDNAELHTLHHLGAGAFAWPGRTVQGRMLEG
jgi:flavin reductase (DIM6/NTAB) family NADH-FMN oxidoreductase RutF